jgi:hypothetical protein
VCALGKAHISTVLVRFVLISDVISPMNVIKFRATCPRRNITDLELLSVLNRLPLHRILTSQQIN